VTVPMTAGAFVCVCSLWRPSTHLCQFPDAHFLRFLTRTIMYAIWSLRCDWRLLRALNCLRLVTAACGYHLHSTLGMCECPSWCLRGGQAVRLRRISGPFCSHLFCLSAPHSAVLLGVLVTCELCRIESHACVRMRACVCVCVCL